ncbi:hypothetical protein [Luteimonas sp. TWI1437]|uniref:hypothetical protein n=1 Tax=unclassified Luteimonas TaxID=2629088 RepID=UPI00320839D8
MTFRFPVGPSHGRCNICGEPGELTANHVPPQGWAKGIALRVASIADTISGDKRPPSYKMPNGVHFRTLCRRCNGALMSPYDKALISMCNQVAALLRDPGKVTFYQSIRVKPQLIARGILGHMCSVGLNRYDETHSRHLSDSASDLLRQVRLHYWVYPYGGRTVLRDFALCNIALSKSAAIYIIKSYPLAFAMVWDRRPPAFSSGAVWSPALS